jgi:hypothetical protein
VVFAFLSFSSSPYALVYCIPAQTIAPIARSAPKEMIPFETRPTKSRIVVFVASPLVEVVGMIAFDFPSPLDTWAQSEINEDAAHSSTGPVRGTVQAAKVLIGVKRTENIEIISFIDIYKESLDTIATTTYAIAIDMTPKTLYVSHFHAFLLRSSLPSAVRSP